MHIYIYIYIYIYISKNNKFCTEDFCEKNWNYLVKLSNELDNWRYAVNTSKKQSMISFMTEVPVVWKAVHWFVLQINGLVSVY